MPDHRYNICCRSNHVILKIKLSNSPLPLKNLCTLMLKLWLNPLKSDQQIGYSCMITNADSRVISTVFQMRNPQINTNIRFITKTPLISKH